MLVVDQFEEVFAREVDAEERRLFIGSVCAAREDLVVLGIRADFYPHALRHPLLAAAIQQSQVVVGPMTVEELRRAVTEPARRAKLDVEPALVELVLRESLPRTTGSGPPPGSAGSGGTQSRAALTAQAWRGPRA
ncbi:nSTAND1 domain-containing NTPase [Streptacidiphilus neutrinimicus]|uniref:nSTAND1 domain-containing NTPase n=1 Tax=Streptacidiphilus neutrinimicus TaxID=105420 RepID=UPI0005AB4119|nr:hypothetical protein [Streptacidiphilus neutrinimicus]